MDAAAQQATAESAPPKMTAADFFARAVEFEHCELVDGEVLRGQPASWKHGRIVARLGTLLHKYIERRGAGEVVGGRVGYQLSDRTVYAADVAVHLTVPEEEIPGWVTTMPDVMVEVVEASDTWTRIERKVADYLAAGVAEVWIADPEHQTISVRERDGGGRRLGIGETLTSSTLEGFSAMTERLFRSKRGGRGHRESQRGPKNRSPL